MLKFHSFVIVDDGTGQITITVWRKHVTANIKNLLTQQHPNESVALGQRLLQLALRSTPVVYPIGNLTCSLAIGDAVQLRGRLQLFRESVTISANYCRRLFSRIQIS